MAKPSLIRFLAIFVAVLVAIGFAQVAAGDSALADGTGDGGDTGYNTVTANAGHDGAHAKGTFGRQATMNLPAIPEGSSMVVNASRPASTYIYRASDACDGDEPGKSLGECSAAVTSCDPADGPGPLSNVWRALIGPDGQGKWDLIGTTCWPAAVPGAPAEPQVTAAMVIEAFHTTPWSTPQISTQPKGDVTLVGLDTYYKVNWTEQGYQPQEVETFTLLGKTVDVRVKLDHFLWKFGDGQTFGPTTYEGGVYPTGSITHQYTKGGTYPASVDTTFTADFRIDGGAWTPLPDTVTVPGPSTVVTAKTARAVLVAH